MKAYKFMISCDNFVNLCDIKRTHIHIYLVDSYGLYVTDFIRETKIEM